MFELTLKVSLTLKDVNTLLRALIALLVLLA